jgi:Asp/Glu/hydantoin racemase
MRILLLNPNTSVGVTDRIHAVAKAVAAPSTEIVAMTAPRGVPYIATRAEALIGAAVALEMLAEAHAQADAVIVAAFGDPGLGALRELATVPVIGLAEAAMLTACMLGRRFGIVSFARALGPLYEECVEWHGLRSRLAAIRLADAAFASIASVQEEMADQIVEVARRTVAEDGADVVILAGAPLAGLAERIAERVPVPLVDGVAAAVRQAETLVCLRPRKASAGSFRRPDPKPAQGLPAAVTRFLGTEDQDRQTSQPQ